MKLAIQFSSVLLLSILLCYQGQAQNSLDLSSSAGISFRLSEKGTIGRRLNKGDDPGFAYRFGAAYSLQVSPKMYLSTGVQYASLASKRFFDAGDLRWGTQWNGTEFDPNIPSGEDFGSFTRRDRKFLIEVPLSLRRYICAQKRFYIHGGLTPSIHLHDKDILEEEGGDREAIRDTNADFQTFQLAARTGVGMDWPLCEKFNLFTQLNGQVNLLEEVADSGLRWWDLSGQVGVRIGL